MPVSIVTPDTLAHVWSRLRPQILKGLRHGAGQHYSEDYYYNNVNNGTMQMWVYHELDVVGAGIISVNEMPNGKTVFIEMLAGEKITEWLEIVEPLLQEYAVQIGATTIEALCRPGLVKKLEHWRPIATLMRLENGRKQQT
jgi:hypothetical protein